MLIVSACLVGIKCKYDSTSAKDKEVTTLVSEGRAIPLCPEQLGGLPTPRPRSKIIGGEGKDVIIGKAKVNYENGKDVTQNFIKGAQETLKIAKLIGAKQAILKSKSPSCGCGKIYNEKDKLIEGDGVCASLLKQNGITVECI